MITKEKLSIYQRYDGDSDGWARANVPREQAAMVDEDWREIDELLMQVSLVKKELATKSFADAVRLQLEKSTADASVAAQIFAIASIG
jgi:hypothetical protein